jgi:DNA-binding transcriptional MerR regulator
MTAKTMQREMVATLVSIDDATGVLGEVNSLEDPTEIRRRVKAAEETLAELERRLGEKASVEVSQAAKILAVSPPTVRAWAKRGILEPLPGRSPIALSFESVRRTRRLLAELRAQGSDREFVQRLLDAALDQRELSRPAAARGLEQWRSGRAVKAATAD